MYSYKEVLREITQSKLTCLEFLQRQHVLPTSKECPGPLYKGKRTNTCGHNMLLKSVKDRNDGYTWRCRKTHSIIDGTKKYTVSDVKVSIRAGTWLQDSNLSLDIIVELLYLWANGFTNSEIQNETKLSKKTIIEWSAYLRDVCMYICMQKSTPIGGSGIEVEIDESKFGKRKYYRGHRVDGKWVFGGRETYDKSKIFMVSVKNRKAKTLLPIISKWIKEGSIIHSDCWKPYDKLSKMGYTHVKVNHSKEFVNKETAACTNRIESEWRHAKVSLPRYGVHRGHHDSYLAQFLWNRRFHDHDKFITIIEHCNDAFKCGHFISLNI